MKVKTKSGEEIDVKINVSKKEGEKDSVIVFQIEARPVKDINNLPVFNLNDCEIIEATEKEMKIVKAGGYTPKDLRNNRK